MLISTYMSMFYMFEKVEGSERESDRTVEVIIPNEIKPQAYRPPQGPNVNKV